MFPKLNGVDNSLGVVLEMDNTITVPLSVLKLLKNHQGFRLTTAGLLVFNKSFLSTSGGVGR
jgi:hypothetical protein